MTWQRAMQEAERWLSSVQLPKPIKGELVNLDDYFSSLTFTDPKDRLIILCIGKKRPSAGYQVG